MKELNYTHTSFKYIEPDLFSILIFIEDANVEQIIGSIKDLYNFEYWKELVSKFDYRDHTPNKSSTNLYILLDKQELKNLEKFFGILNKHKTKIIRSSFEYSKIDELEKELFDDAYKNILAKKDLESKWLNIDEKLSISTWKNDFKKEIGLSLIKDESPTGFTDSKNSVIRINPSKVKIQLTLSMVFAK